MSEDRPLIKYGKDDNTITINNNNFKQEEWHDDRRGKMMLNGQLYFVNLKNKNDEGWIAGKIVKATSEQQEKWLEGNAPASEKKTEVKDQDKKDDDLDDEIPF